MVLINIVSSLLVLMYKNHVKEIVVQMKSIPTMSKIVNMTPVVGVEAAEAAAETDATEAFAALSKDVIGTELHVGHRCSDTTSKHLQNHPLAK